MLRHPVIGRRRLADPGLALVSILKGIAGAMQFFEHEGFRLAFIDQQPEAGGEPVLLIHGFASIHAVNWVSTGWVRTLNDAGYRVIAFDNRGHGQPRRRATMRPTTRRKRWPATRRRCCAISASTGPM